MDGKATSAFKRFLGHFHFARPKKDGGSKDERLPDDPLHNDEQPQLSDRAAATSRRRSTSRSGGRQQQQLSSGARPPETAELPLANGTSLPFGDSRPPAAAVAAGAAAVPRAPMGLIGYDFKDAQDVLDKVLALTEDEAADDETLRLLCAELLRRAEFGAASSQGDSTFRSDRGLTAARAAFEFSKFLLNDNAEIKRACQTRLLQAIEACDRAAGQPSDAFGAASSRTALYYSTVA